MRTYPKIFIKEKFTSFFVTHFLSSLSDSLIKATLWLLITQQNAIYGNSYLLAIIESILFILPMVVASGLAGLIVDRYPKHLLIRYGRIFDVVIILLFSLALLLKESSLLLLSSFLLGLSATFYLPIKYSILPELVRNRELVNGNAFIEASTFVAIALSILLASILSTTLLATAGVTIILLVTSILSCYFSWQIPAVIASAPEIKIKLNIFNYSYKNIKELMGNKSLFLATLGISWFWFYNTVFLLQFPEYINTVLQTTPQIGTFLIVIFLSSISLGCLWCSKISNKHMELGLVPIGSLIVSIAYLDLTFSSYKTFMPSLTLWQFINNFNGLRIIVDLLGIGIGSGYYTLHLYTFMQMRSIPAHRGRLMATSALCNALFILLACILCFALFKWQISILHYFVLLASFNVIVTSYIYSVLPEFLMRFLVWLLVHTIYKISYQNLNTIPEKGPVILVCNHVSFVDAVIIAAVCRRPIRFVMDYRIYNTPGLNFIFKTAKAIPIASNKEDPTVKNQAFNEIAQALDAGDIICIFPEGEITRTGEINTFKKGIEIIVSRSKAPVIPLALQGLWGSFFSRKYGRAMSVLPDKFFGHKVGVVAGAAVEPHLVTASRLEQEVKQLRGHWQ